MVHMESEMFDSKSFTNVWATKREAELSPATAYYRQRRAMEIPSHPPRIHDPQVGRWSQVLAFCVSRITFPANLCDFTLINICDITLA